MAIWSGFAYAAFVVDVFSRRIVGWRVATTLRASLALDALEIAIWSRHDVVIESFWSRCRSRFSTGNAGARTRAELANAIFGYLEIFHNLRASTSLGTLTHVEVGINRSRRI